LALGVKLEVKDMPAGVWLVESGGLGRQIASFACDGRNTSASEPVGPLLRRGESTGRPVGDSSFLATIGRLVGRDLAPKSRGPKPKGRAKEE